MTDQQLYDIARQHEGEYGTDMLGFSRAIESTVHSQDEELLRNAREALQAARDELAREVGLPLAACVGGAFRPINAALSALNARLGDSKKEMSE